MGLPAEFPNFPECDASAAVTVNVGTDQPLPDGKYGDLTINGGTLRLQGGDIDVTGTGSPELNLGAVVGNRCSVGTLSLTSLQKKNGRLVYP